jgi:hypothetical protein
VCGLQAPDLGTPRFCLNLEETTEKAFVKGEAVDECGGVRGSELVCRSEALFHLCEESRINGKVAESGDGIPGAESVAEAIT